MDKKINNFFLSRQNGKAMLIKEMRERMLNAGKTILYITPKGQYIQRRVKHLTLIKNIPEKTKE